MKNISLAVSILVQEKEEEVLLVLDMVNSELYKVDGDAGLMLNYINKNTAEKLNLDQIKGHLNSVSKTFKKNPEQDKTIKEALTYFKEIKLVNYES